MAINTIIHPKGYMSYCQHFGYVFIHFWRQ